MSSELVKVVRCDVCGAEGATEHAGAIDGTGWEIDLCQGDSGALEALQSLLRAKGREPRARGAKVSVKPPDKPKRGRPRRIDADPATERPWQTLGRDCPLCEYVGPTRSGTGQHVIQHHGTTQATAEREAGREWICDVCGQARDSYDTLSRHVTKAHANAEETAA